MKKTAKLLIKGLLVITLFSGSAIVLSNFGVQLISEANAAVSYQQAYQYLVNQGYTVIEMRQKGTNWVAHTVVNSVHYTTTVFTSGNEIVGVESVPM